MKASRAVGLLVACLAVCTCAEAAARSGPAGRARLLLATPALSYGQVYSQLNATEADVLQFVDSLDGTLVLAGQPQVRGISPPGGRAGGHAKDAECGSTCHPHKMTTMPAPRHVTSPMILPFPPLYMCSTAEPRICHRS